MKNKKRKQPKGGGEPIMMGEIIAPATDVPGIPSDTRQADTAVDFIVKGKGKQKDRHFVEKCRLIGSVENGILTVSVRNQGVILSLRLTDVMAFMAAVTQAAHAEEELSSVPAETV